MFRRDKKARLGTKGNRIVAWLRMRLNFQPPQTSENRNDLNTMLNSTIRELCRPGRLSARAGGCGDFTRTHEAARLLRLETAMPFCNPNRYNRALNRG